MSIRVLVVEDKPALYQEYMNIFAHFLPLERMVFEHAATITGALEVIGEEWDVIVTGYSLGAKAPFRKRTIRNGADLVDTRRMVENERQGPKASFIVGFSSSTATNELLERKGSNISLPKTRLIDMVRLIQGNTEAK